MKMTKKEFEFRVELLKQISQITNFTAENMKQKELLDIIIIFLTEADKDIMFSKMKNVLIDRS